MTAHELWSVREQDFPVSADRRQQLRFTLTYAVLAPSSHNTQPWRFHILNGGGGVDLWMDRTRSLPVADPDDRELTISCGAALLQLRLAMENFGPQTFTELLPDPSQPNWAARIAATYPPGPPPSTIRSNCWSAILSPSPASGLRMESQFHMETERRRDSTEAYPVSLRLHVNRHLGSRRYIPATLASVSPWRR